MRRLPILALGFASLLLAIGGGLARLGFALGPLPPAAVALHGPLMVAGFLGTLIGLERAVGFGRAWGYAAPVATGVGALLAVATGGAPFARTLVAIGGVPLTAMLWIGLRGPRTPSAAAQILGAACFTIGSAIWAGGAAVPSALPWWSAFLVSTIAGERLELSRLLAPPAAAFQALGAALALGIAGALISWTEPQAGARAIGVGWIAVASWLGRWDLARRSLRRGGLPQFMARTLLAGYAWLAAAGLLAIAFGAPSAGPHYDAILHALFVGFAFAMIFAHAPVIFPSVLGLPVAFRSRFYAHVLLLQLGLVLRVAGDLLDSFAARRWGGLVSALAILLFLIQTASSLGREPNASRI